MEFLACLSPEDLTAIATAVGDAISIATSRGVMAFRPANAGGPSVTEQGGEFALAARHY